MCMTKCIYHTIVHNKKQIMSGSQYGDKEAFVYEITHTRVRLTFCTGPTTICSRPQGQDKKEA